MDKKTNEIQSKSRGLGELDKLVLKSVRKSKGSRILKHFYWKKKKEERFALLDSTHYKTIIINTVWYWHIDKKYKGKEEIGPKHIYANIELAL